MVGNPLHDGLRIEPTPGPTTLVIFGASGDLTRRKLLPAIYRLARRGRLPAQFAVIGISRTPMADEAFRTQFRDSLKEFAGSGTGRDEIAESLASRHVLRCRRNRRCRVVPTAAGAPHRDQWRGRRALLSGRAADGLRNRDRATGRVGSRRRAAAGLAPHYRRETVRHGSRQRARAQSPRAPALRRRAGLSHRSLSREGDRPEPARVPVWQRHVRTGVESPLYRSRPDHRRRDRRCRAPRRVLRGRRRAARHGAEPPDAGVVARRDGAADRLQRRERPRSKDGRAAGRAAARRRTAPTRRAPAAT